MSKTRGKFIILLGINNLGKSTQAHLLVENLQNYGFKTEYLKYPIYELEPTGPQINDIIRGGQGQDISEIELQKIYAQNRRDFQPELEKKLNKGITVVAEDYVGTGLAWGVTKGANLEKLEKQNADLTRGDLAIVLDGQRFIEAKEDNHIHEQDDELMEKCRQVHLDLAKKYGWQIVNANQSVEDVKKDIWEIVGKQLDPI